MRDPYHLPTVNHYEVLGVSPDSEAGEIRRAYLSAARRYHPDFHADADEATRVANARRMQELNQAWEVLGDGAARSAYDRTLRTNADPGVARRAAREPDLPEGKGWTPRLGDDGWMDDFGGWANEVDELPPDEARSTGRRMATMAPVGVLLGSFVVIFLGMVVDTDVVVAAGVMGVVLSGGLFVLLPMFEMARGRRRG